MAIYYIGLHGEQQQQHYLKVKPPFLFSVSESAPPKLVMNSTFSSSPDSWNKGSGEDPIFFFIGSKSPSMKRPDPGPAPTFTSKIYGKKFKVFSIF